MKMFVVLFVCVLVGAEAMDNLYDTLQTEGMFYQFLQGVDASGYTDELVSGGPFTLFAPTDDAAAKLPPSIINELENNITFLSEALMYHAANGSVMSNTLYDNMMIPSELEYPIRINIYTTDMGKVITAGGCKISKADVMATNGVIHELDSVMLPVMAPIPKFLNNNANMFSTLLKALSIAGLTPALAGTGPFTLFAPSNEAFAKIPEKDLQELLNDKVKLTKVLEYHVVQGALFSPGLNATNTIMTLARQTIMVKASSGGVMINSNSHVVMADISVSNGVVHTLDTVLMPTSTTWSPQAQKAFGNPRIYFN